MTREEIVALLERPTWMAEANCRGLDPDLFFPQRGQPTEQAKQVCRACDVQAECLTYAVNHGEKFGTWGGMSERERRKIRRRHSLTTVAS